MLCPVLLPSPWSLNVPEMLVQMLLGISRRICNVIAHGCGLEDQLFPRYFGDCFTPLGKKLKFSLQAPSIEWFLPFLNPLIAYIFTSMIVVSTLTDSGVNYLLHCTVLCFLAKSLNLILELFNITSWPDFASWCFYLRLTALGTVLSSSFVTSWHCEKQCKVGWWKIIPA